VVEEFAQMGFQVAVDNEVQDGAGMNPFPVLKASMSPETWRKVSAALEEALDPEWGGDERLAALLRRTNLANQEQRRRVS
jgi:hypothetical protein